jgi:hypothetical protein
LTRPPLIDIVLQLHLMGILLPARASSVRVRAALLVAALVGAGASEALHEGLVRHVRCAEHGEWVHATDARAAVGVAPGAAAVAGVERGEPHDHEHCARDVVMAADEVRSPAPERCPAGAEVAARARAARPAIDVLSVAPKASPPARC